MKLDALREAVLLFLAAWDLGPPLPRNDLQLRVAALRAALDATPGPQINVERLAKVLRGMNLTPPGDSESIAATIARRYGDREEKP